MTTDNASAHFAYQVLINGIALHVLARHLPQAGRTVDFFLFLVLLAAVSLLGGSGKARWYGLASAILFSSGVVLGLLHLDGILSVIAPAAIFFLCLLLLMLKQAILPVADNLDLAKENAIE
jgi:hypothetical protein